MDIMEMATPMIEKLSTLTADASKRADQPDGPGVKVARSTTTLLNLLSALSDDDKTSLFSVGVRPNALIEVERALSTLREELKPSTRSDDRSEGDKLAAWLVASIEAALIDGDDRERAESVVEAWTATAPTTRQSRSVSASSTSAAFGPLGFTVEAACTRCAFKAATTRDNLNSIRDQVKRHEVDKHGASKDGLGRASTFHAAATEALDVVMHGDRTEAHPAAIGWNIKSSGKVVAPKPDAQPDAAAA